MSAKPTILIVEDSPTQALQISRRIQSFGLRTVCSGDGLEALQLVYSERPALVILDVNLPGMDGFQVCTRVKRDPDMQHIPIIMLTSASSAASTIHGLEVGANDYIPKDTFAMDNLVAALTAYLKLPEI